jgi:hypothetical protein
MFLEDPSWCRPKDQPVQGQGSETTETSTVQVSNAQITTPESSQIFALARGCAECTDDSSRAFRFPFCQRRVQEDNSYATPSCLESGRKAIDNWHIQSYNDSIGVAC